VQIELISAAIEAGRIPAAQVALNLDTLRRVAELDPAETRVAIVRGNQYLLMAQPRTEQAIASYREAQRLEPRPETYVHLGQAYEMAGRPDEARRYYRLALRLDPFLAPNVPAGMQ
jgi:tetratricopeptide (TPR) repeat protein